MALDLLQKGREDFDMVIADAHMKEMNGFRFLQALIDHEINIPFVRKLSSIAELYVLGLNIYIYIFFT